MAEAGAKMRRSFGVLKGTDKRRRERERWQTLEFNGSVGRVTGVHFYVDGEDCGVGDVEFWRK